MASEPTISVIIPAWNRKHLIGETLQSICRQTRVPDEIIVIDDGSTDGTAAAARAACPTAKILSQENRGLPFTRNRGIATATGDLLCFLDSDDLWLPTKTERQLQTLREDCELEMVFCHTQQFHDDDAARAGAPQPGFCAGTMMARRSAVDRVGPFDADIEVGEFIEWFSRAKARGVRYACLPDCLHRRRIHAQNLGVTHLDQRLDYVAAARAMLERRRRARDKPDT